MSRLAQVFPELRARQEIGLVTYVTAGDPNLSQSRDILRALGRAGADVIEIGVPFSDTVADGPAIQRASERALAAGSHLDAHGDRGARDDLGCDLLGTAQDEGQGYRDQENS